MNKTTIEPNLVAITSPYMDNNTFLIFNQKDVLIVDPSFSGDDIIKAIPDGCKPIGILLTHAHFDHCFDCAKLAQHWKIPVYMHELEKETYKKYRYDELAGMKTPDFSKYIKYFKTPKLHIKDFELSIFLTPGHSAGSVVYQYKNWFFVGDTLFYNSYGRTDLDNSNPIDMIKSLNYLWKNLHEENLILPGHGRWGTFKQIETDNQLVKDVIKR